MYKNVLIRCDASETIGLGHVTRCLVLANQFRDNGYKVYFAIKNNKLSKEKLSEQKFTMFIAEKKDFNYFVWIENILIDNNINIFIGDIRDGFPVELIYLMKRKKILTVAIDEPSTYAKECDICFYPPHAKINKTEYKGKIFQGLEYVLLRKEFYCNYIREETNLSNILIFMGGTDPYNLSLSTLKKLDKSNDKFIINIIVPKNHKDKDKIFQFRKESLHPLNIYQDVKDMSTFLNKIDYSICSFGTIIYELISKSIPSLCYILSDEDIIIDYLKDNGFIFTSNIEKNNIDKLFRIKNKNFKIDNFSSKIIEKIFLYSNYR